MENNELEFRTGDEITNGEENLINPHQDDGIETVTDIETFENIEQLLEDTDDNGSQDEPETEVETNPEKVEKTETNTDETTGFQDLANYLKEQTILGDISEYEDDDFKFDGSESSFKELMDRHAQKKAFDFLENEIIPALPPSARKKVELLFKEELDADSAEEIGEKLTNYQSLSKEAFEKDIELAKKTYSDYLKSRGMDDDEIEEYVQRAVDMEEIVDKAVKSTEKLVKNVEKEIEASKEKAKIEEQRRADEQVKRLENIKSSTAAFVKKVKSADFNIDEKLAEKIYESRTKIVGQSKDKQPLNKIGQLAQTDPEGFQNALHLLGALDVFKVDKNGNITTDFTKVAKSATSAAKKGVIKSIDSITNKFKTGKAANISSDPESEEEFLDELRGIIK